MIGLQASAIRKPPKASFQVEDFVLEHYGSSSSSRKEIRLYDCTLILGDGSSSAYVRLEGLGAEAILKTKETIYDNLVRHILVEGYPAEGFRRTNVIIP